MIEVFKIVQVHNIYDLRAVVKLNFNSFSTSRGNKYKLQRFYCHYDIRKYSFVSRVVNVWNSLPDYVVEADSLNAVKIIIISRLLKEVDKRNHNTNKKMKIEICKTNKNAVVKLF